MSENTHRRPARDAAFLGRAAVQARANTVLETGDAKQIVPLAARMLGKDLAPALQ